MTDTKNPAASGGSDDPWEQLAEDLFGLDFGKEHASLEPSPPPNQSPEPAVPQRVADFSSAVVFEADEAADEDEPDRGAVPPSSNLPAEPVIESSAESPRAPNAQDSYWDALANWNWGESEGSSSRGKSSESRRGDSPRGGGPRGRDEARSSATTTTERPAPAPAETREETRRTAPSDFAEVGDFGLGVSSPAPGRGSATRGEGPQDRLPAAGEAAEADDYDDEEEVESDSSETITGESDSAGAGEEGAPRKRRRRRRRRRSRNGNESAGAPAPAGEVAPVVPGGDWDQPEVAPPAQRADDRPRRPAAEAPPHRERSEERSRGSRRRRGDRRGPGSQPAEQRSPRSGEDFEVDSFADEVTDVGGGSPGFAADDDSAEGGDALVPFGEVPSWEEAISYLLQPNRVQVDSNGGSGSHGDSRSGDQPRQTRHYGGRRS